LTIETRVGSANALKVDASRVAASAGIAGVPGLQQSGWRTGRVFIDVRQYII
jgi:hypothetical protein